MQGSQHDQASDLMSTNSTKTSQPCGKARDYQTKRQYPNPFNIETYKRDWEKFENEVKELKEQ